MLTERTAQRAGMPCPSTWDIREAVGGAGGARAGRAIQSMRVVKHAWICIHVTFAMDRVRLMLLILQTPCLLLLLFLCCST